MPYGDLEAVFVGQTYTHNPSSYTTALFLLAIPMSSSNQIASPSTDNFSAIFNAASNEYQRLTGKSLDTHPFAAQLDTCQNPEAISNVLQKQAQAFSKFRKGDEKLMAWLDPTIHILFTFSATLGEGIGLVSKLVHLRTTVLQHRALSHSPPQKRFSPGSVFFSEYVFSPIVVSHDIQ
jgi:hypothetical protein